MGSRRNPTLYKLVFSDDTDYAGLEMTLRSVTIGQMRTLRSGISSEAEANDQLLTLIASRLVEWNREDEDGTPLPPTKESLEGEELGFIHVVLDRWTTAVMGVAAPLESGSNAGEISPEVNIPTEALSSSLAS